jgi:hypothetical protein
LFFKVRLLTVRATPAGVKRKRYRPDTKKQIRLISDPNGQTLDGSGTGVVGIAAASGSLYKELKQC